MTETSTERPHELVEFRQRAFGDGGHWYHEGFDRAVCSCGWKSAPSRDHKALAVLFRVHNAPTQRPA